MERKKVEHHPFRENERPTRGQVLSVILLSTALVFLWALYIRGNIVESPFQIEEALELDWFAPYLLGFALQETILPIALLFIFSRTALIKDLLNEFPSERTIWKSVPLFLLLQFLVFLYRFALLSRTEDQATLGILIVLAAAIFGGWRAGLIVGFFTSFAVATLNSIVWIEPPDVFDLTGLLENVVFDMDALLPLWVGLTLGLVAERVGKRRFSPIFMVLATSLLILVSFALILIGTDEPGELAERALPSMAILALSMLALSYMVRGLKNEDIVREAEATQLQLAQTELALSKAELRALHAQINPHFFFNTLNTIRYFVRTDPDMARDLLIKLSDIFQRVLQAKEFVSLKEELAFVDAYLELEKARLEERLQIHWPEIDEKLLQTQLPTLILQPLVENAVLHGAASREEGGEVRIEIGPDGGDLLILVADNGPGFSADNKPESSEESQRPSVALSNIDERLKLVYGEAYRLGFDQQEKGWTKVRLRIPLEGTN